MKKYKIVNKNRFYTFITLLFILSVIILSIFTTSLRAHSRILKQNYKELVVYPGDTLWDIALEYKPSDYDVRDMVYQIKEFNNMETSYIIPGEVLKIPMETK